MTSRGTTLSVCMAVHVPNCQSYVTAAALLPTPYQCPCSMLRTQFYLTAENSWLRPPCMHQNALGTHNSQGGLAGYQLSSLMRMLQQGCLVWKTLRNQAKLPRLISLDDTSCQGKLRCHTYPGHKLVREWFQTVVFHYGFESHQLFNQPQVQQQT